MRKDDKDFIRENYFGLEDGSIYFFYRPRLLEAHGPGDVEHLYFVLHPFTWKKYRLISLDTALLPEDSDHYNFVTGSVLLITEKPAVLRKELKERTRQVHGVAEIRQAAARACGEGIYTIMKTNGTTHLLYALGLPGQAGKIPSELGLGSEGNLEIGVYNPYYDIDDDGRPLKGPPLPDGLRLRLDNERIYFDSVPELLDYEGISLALFRRPALSNDLTNSLKPSKDTFDGTIITDLRLRRNSINVDPLFTDEWV